MNSYMPIFCVHTCFVLLNLPVLENVAFLREACIMRSNKNVSGAGKKDDVLFDRQCIIKMPAFLVYDGSTHQQQRIGVWYEDFQTSRQRTFLRMPSSEVNAFVLQNASSLLRFWRFEVQYVSVNATFYLFC